MTGMTGMTGKLPININHLIAGALSVFWCGGRSVTPLLGRR